MKDHSIFITASGVKSEHHDLSKAEAMDMGLHELFSGAFQDLIPDVTVEIRNPKGIVYHAHNPPKVDIKDNIINFI
jgi:hypothetical protein